MRTVYLPIYTLRPFERGIQKTLGKYCGFVMPGLGSQTPFIHVVRIRDIREHIMEQQRRSMRLLATGEFEAAEQQKLAIIQRLQGEREAAIQVAQGKAEQMEIIKTSLRDNAKIVMTEHGISPTLLLGSLPVTVADVAKNGRQANVLP